MINKRVVIEVEMDRFNRFLISSDPSDDRIEVIRQKRNDLNHFHSTLSTLILPTDGCEATLEVAAAIIDAVNLTGALREDNNAVVADFFELGIARHTESSTSVALYDIGPEDR